MAPSKPRNAVFNDAVVALCALKAHFAIADDHPTDKSGPDLYKLMLLHVPNAPRDSPSWKGEYYAACQIFSRDNEPEMQRNNCTLESLLKSQSGESLWRKALEYKRVMLNEIHTIFCQEVCPQWPSVPSGTTSLDPLLFDLRKRLWQKKAQEIKEGKVLRADSRVQEMEKIKDAAALQYGLLSAEASATAVQFDGAAKDLVSVKAEEVRGTT